MIDGNVIFIFTKNRFELLKETCTNILLSAHNIYVIDDSSDSQTKHQNEAFCLTENICYFGTEKQNQLIEYLKAKGYETEYFLKKLGDCKWNLGFARNHALIISAINKFKKVLFLDDDILIDTPLTFNKIFSKLDDHDFVGTKIVGMPDDSVLGHIANRVGFNFRRMYSGGCLAFNTKIIDNFFLNMYNEDWIWLYFQSLNFKHTEFGEAWQAFYDPFENFQTKVLFQEIGEVSIDGLEDAALLGDLTLTKEEGYWEEKLEERKIYLVLLRESCDRSNEQKARLVIDWLLKNYPSVLAKTQAELFRNYFSKKETFANLYRELLSC